MSTNQSTNQTVTTGDDWVERLTGDEPEKSSAISELTHILTLGLRKLLSSRNQSTDLADDFAQESVLKILSSIETFEGRSRFTTWAMSIATRVAISKMRRSHFKDVSLDAITGGEGLKFDLAIEKSATASVQADRNSIVSMLARLISEKLTDKQQIAVRCLLGGMPVENIAERTDSNRNAVYKLIHDARLKLKAGFEEHGISAEDIGTIFDK